MNRSLLTGLALIGLSWLANLTMPAAKAGGRPHGTGCPCPHCSPGYARTGCRDCCLSSIAKWALCCDYYILPPDYGWVQPAKVPVIRQGVTYYRYWPEAWYGTGSVNPGEYKSYPMVYSPTDTTQLGFTYQHVPSWQPNPWRSPPPPVPSQWHVREAHYGYHGRWHDYYTPIHHHQPPRGTYVVEPLRPMPAKQQPALPMPNPLACPPAPEPSTQPQPVIIPLPAVPAVPTPTPADEPPAPTDKTAEGAPVKNSAFRSLRQRTDG